VVSASLKDVAALAGVSVGTVSNVLNRPDRVAAPTLARVRAAIDELGFVPNAQARTLRSNRTHVLGLVVPDISNPFFTDVARGVEDAAMEAGYSVILCNTDEKAAREDRYLSILESQKVSGIIITPARRTLRPLTRLLENGVAVTLLDSPASRARVCSVSVDHATGGRLAADHAAVLGHANVAWIAGPREIPQVAAREKGLTTFARTHAMSVASLPTTSMSAAAGEAAMRRALSARFTATAVICANDLLALGAMRALRDAGLRVPDDISVIGYDDIDFAASAAVPLTSVRQPRYELGHAAAELVISEARDPNAHEHRHVDFQPTLVVRESTGAAPR
jgi:LacI family transcriptional regulator